MNRRATSAAGFWQGLLCRYTPDTWASIIERGLDRTEATKLTLAQLGGKLHHRQRPGPRVHYHAHEKAPVHA